MQNITNLARSLPPIRGGRFQQGYQINEEGPHSESFGFQQGSVSAPYQEQDQSLESNILLQSSGLIQRVLVQKVRVLGSLISEINKQIDQRRNQTAMTLAHFQKCQLKLMNDELVIEGWARSHTRDPTGNSKAVTSQLIHQFNRDIATERQKAFGDEIKLTEERRRLVERYENYKMSLDIFQPNL